MLRPDRFSTGTWMVTRRRSRFSRTVVLLVVAVIMAGCSGGHSSTRGGGTAAATTTSEAATTVPATTGAATTAEPQALPDGRHPVFVTRVDAKGRTITFDLIRFYTGDAAVKAAAADHQESPPPNDYYIRNTNPRLRTLPVRPGAPITVNVLAAESTGSATKNITVTLDKLAGWFPNPIKPMFWITVRGGTVTKINEQYLP